MFTIVKNRLVFALALAGIPSVVLAQPPTTIIVNASSGRPLADAAGQLEQQVGIAVNYEDIPYAFAGDVRDVTTSVMSPANQAANPGAHILVPKGGALSIDPIPGSVVSASPVGAVTSALTTLVNAYSANQFPGGYTVTWSDGAFFLVPSKTRTVSGSEVALTPVFNTLITLPMAQRTAAATLRAILDQVKSNSGVKVGFGTVPLQLFATARVTLGADNEPARNVIGRMLSILAPATAVDGSALCLLSYKLLFDPGLSYYMFSAHMLPNRSANSSGPVAPAGASVQPAGSSPYLKPPSSK